MKLYLNDILFLLNDLIKNKDLNRQILKSLSKNSCDYKFNDDHWIKGIESLDGRPLRLDRYSFEIVELSEHPIDGEPFYPLEAIKYINYSCIDSVNSPKTKELFSQIFKDFMGLKYIFMDDAFFFVPKEYVFSVTISEESILDKYNTSLILAMFMNETKRSCGEDGYCKRITGIVCSDKGIGIYYKRGDGAASFDSSKLNFDLISEDEKALEAFEADDGQVVKNSFLDYLDKLPNMSDFKFSFKDKEDKQSDSVSKNDVLDCLDKIPSMSNLKVLLESRESKQRKAQKRTKEERRLYYKKRNIKT